MSQQASQRSPLLDDGDAVQKAIEAVDAHFPTSAAYGLLSNAMEDGIQAFIAAQDRADLVSAVCERMGADGWMPDDVQFVRDVIDKLLGGP